jgi:hypothetical protein
MKAARRFDSTWHTGATVGRTTIQALLAGSRDPDLAADPELHYTDSAEILFLL